MRVDVRQHIPNALTILRFAAIPVFVWLFLDAGDDAAWGAGLFFAGAALTDQLDGYLARRWHVESAFGKVADPLADRLMIVVAVVLLWLEGRLPLAAMLIVLARDVVLVLGYKVVVPRGYDVRGQLPRKARDLGAVRLARLRHRHAEGDGLAARALLDRCRARDRRGRRVRPPGAPNARGAKLSRRARAGTPSSAAN